MFTASTKIPKKDPKDITKVEQEVTQALFDLEAGSSELKTDLKDLHIVSAKEVSVEKGGKKAVVVFIPYKQRHAYHRIQQRLVRELEKKLGGRHVVFIIQRHVMHGKNGRTSSGAAIIASRTVAVVQKAMLDDLVYPSEIVGKRIRFRLDGSSQLKVFLDKKDKSNTDYKLDTFASVYKALTGKNTVFEYPASESFGKQLYEHGTVVSDIAKCRIEIDQCRYLTLAAANAVDAGDAKTAMKEISEAKIAVFMSVQNIIDRAMQVHGGEGLDHSHPLAYMFAMNRTLRYADGPDEVHIGQLGKIELKKAPEVHKLLAHQKSRNLELQKQHNVKAHL